MDLAALALALEIMGSSEKALSIDVSALNPVELEQGLRAAGYQLKPVDEPVKLQAVEFKSSFVFDHENNDKPEQGAMVY